MGSWDRMVVPLPFSRAVFLYGDPISISRGEDVEAARLRVERALNELANERMIGSVAGSHYSFMGATDPLELEPYAREVAGHLKADAVEAVILSPV